jgi:hypothetical protein
MVSGVYCKLDFKSLLARKPDKCPVSNVLSAATVNFQGTRSDIDWGGRLLLNNQLFTRRIIVIVGIGAVLISSELLAIRSFSHSLDGFAHAIGTVFLQSATVVADIVPATSKLGASPEVKLVVAKRPTVVAFFPPVSDTELSNNPDTNESLADFQFYATRVREKLHAAGIDFEVIYELSFAVKSGTKTTIFRPKNHDVGYYFVEPGKSPRIEYGVMTDDDILHVAIEYFRLAQN